MLSFPLLPYLLNLTRLLRLALPARLMSHYLVRTIGARPALGHAKESERGRELSEAIDSRVPGTDHEGAGH